MLGLALVLTGGLAAGLLFQAAGNRSEVVAVAHDVAKNDVLDADDLRVARVGTDKDVATVPASDLDDLLGRIAATDLVEGEVLSPAQVLPAGERAVQPEESVVGLLVSPGDAPLGQLSAGSPVKVVVRPSQDSGEIEVVSGWLLDTSAAALSTGDRPVSVVIPEDRAGDVSAAAAEDRVTLAVDED